MRFAYLQAYLWPPLEQNVESQSLCVAGRHLEEEMVGSCVGNGKCVECEDGGRFRACSGNC